MAGKYFLKFFFQSSKETFDNFCSPCFQAGKKKEAKHFCVECRLSFCEDCLLDHNKFPALKSHQILDSSGKEKGQQKEAEGALPTERCAIHHGKLIDMFCGDHDEVYCAACIAIKHRSCENVDYLPDFAQGIQDSLNDALSRMKQLRKTRKGNLESLDQDKDLCIKEIEKYENELNQKIEELSKDAKKQICSKHEEYRKVVQSDVDALDTEILKTSTSIQKISSANEAHVFANVIGCKRSMQDYETLLRSLSSGKAMKTLKFTFNVELSTLGLVSKDIKGYKATLYGKFSVAPNRVHVSAACAMEDGTYLISDLANQHLVRLNDNFIVTEEITVDERPYSLQRIGQKEAVVFYSSGNVQMVSIGDSLQLKTLFRADKTSAGGGPFNTRSDEMFLIKNQQMSINRKSGDTLRTYENKDICQNREPKQAALSDDNNTIYFANYDRGLLALTREGMTR